MVFYNPIYKNELFFASKTHISTPFTQDIYMAFLLTWTYFNDVNGSRNILINSHLKRIFFYEQRQEKMKQNRERLKKHENNSNESDFSQNEIPDLNS